jgi:hypothetical protein
VAVTKSAELAVKENAKKEPKTFEEAVPEWLHDYCSVFERVLYTPPRVSMDSTKTL